MQKTTCEEVVKKLKSSSQKITRAQILLKADINAPNWIDDRIAEAFGCSRRAVEQVRERLVTEGFEIALKVREQQGHKQQGQKQQGQYRAAGSGLAFCLFDLKSKNLSHHEITSISELV